MSRRIVQAILKYRLPIVVIIIGLTFFFFYHLLDQLRHAKLYREAADIAPKNHPFVKLQGYMNEVFGIGQLIEIVLEVKEGDIFQPETLAKLYRISDKLYDLRGVMHGNVISLASRSRVKSFRTYLDERGITTLMIENWNDLAQKAITDPAFLPIYRQRVLSNEQVYGRLLAWDKKSTVILAYFWSDKDYRYLFKNISQILKAEEDANHRFHMAGRIIALGYLAQYMNQMLFLFGLAILLIMAMLFLAFRTIRGIFIPLWAGFVTVVWGLGSEALLGIQMDIMSIVVPFMIMAIEVSHSVQILNRYYEEFARWGDNKRACEEALVGLWRPGISSILTDGVGFATLFFIPFQLLQQMAWSATYGVLRIFITTLIFLPALLSFLPPPKEKELERFRQGSVYVEKILGRIADFTWGKEGRRIVLAIAIGLIGIGIIGTQRVELGELQEGYPIFWPNSEYNEAERILNSSFFGTNPYLIHIKGKGRGALAQPDIVADVNALQRRLESRAEVRGTLSYVDVIKGVNQALHNNDPRWYVLPDTYTTNYQMLEIFRTGGGVEHSKGYFEIDFSEANLAVFVTDHRGKTIRGLLQETYEFIKNKKKSVAEIHQAAGIIGVFAAILDEIEKGQAYSLILVSTMILFFCLLTFRSLVTSLIILIPLGIGSLITFATMGFGHIGLFIYTVPVASLGIGLGVDYALYITSRLREEVSQGGNNLEKAYHRALISSGKSVLYTALSVSIGISILLFSPLRFQAILGGMLAVVVLANMLGAIFLLPILLRGQIKWKG
jgi:hypothetical protein